MSIVKNYKVTKHNSGGCCPECNADWGGGDIYEHFLEAKFNPNHEQHNYYKDMTLKEIKEVANGYGWTEEAPLKWERVIGIDCSMDPFDESEDGMYDGVSYWQCPECEIAWHRFKGDRTDKFVKKLKPLLPKLTEEIVEEQIIYNAIQTPDGTIISSDHRHDYVTHEDKNGKTYAVDGGQDYLRRTGDISDCKDLSMYLEPWSSEFHERARKVVKRGGRGKNGDQPITWVPICEMNDNWVLATIEYNTERGMSIESSWFTNLLVKEQEYRELYDISISEIEEDPHKPFPYGSKPDINNIY